MTLDKIEVDDVLSYLYDTGAFDYTACFAKVVKLGSKKIKVRFETGVERWKYPSYFSDKCSDATVAALRAEGVNI